MKIYACIPYDPWCPENNDSYVSLCQMIIFDSEEEAKNFCANNCTETKEYFIETGTIICKERN